MGVSERTVRRWIKSGRLKAYKPGRDYRIPETGLRAFIEESEISPKAPAPPSLEPSFNDVLEEERRAYGFADAIKAAAAKWAEEVSTPGMNDQKRFGILDAALDLAGFVEEGVEAEAWDDIPNEERKVIIDVLEGLNEVAIRGVQHMQDERLEEEAEQRREQIRERTRRIA